MCVLGEGRVLCCLFVLGRKAPAVVLPREGWGWGIAAGSTLLLGVLPEPLKWGFLFLVKTGSSCLKTPAIASADILGQLLKILFDSRH